MRNEPSATGEVIVIIIERTRGQAAEHVPGSTEHGSPSTFNPRCTGTEQELPTMKLSKLLATRKIIIQHANLANLAYSYFTLKRLADRVAHADLRGRVKLRTADAANDRYWAALTALEGNQSVIEEHFSDEDIMDLADAVAFAIEGEFEEITFRLDEMTEAFVNPLRLILNQAGITIDLDQPLPHEAG